jgi:hypothetical protein
LQAAERGAAAVIFCIGAEQVVVSSVCSSVCSLDLRLEDGDFFFFFFFVPNRAFQDLSNVVDRVLVQLISAFELLE